MRNTLIALISLNYPKDTLLLIRQEGLQANAIGPYIVMSCLNTFYNLPLPLITLIIDQIMELSYQAETWWVSSPLYIF